jgi:hypothetical protein
VQVREAASRSHLSVLDTSTFVLLLGGIHFDALDPAKQQLDDDARFFTHQAAGAQGKLSIPLRGQPTTGLFVPDYYSPSLCALSMCFEISRNADVKNTSQSCIVTLLIEAIVPRYTPRSRHWLYHGVCREIYP